MSIRQDDPTIPCLQSACLAEGDDIVAIARSACDSSDLTLRDTAEDEILTSELSFLYIGVECSVTGDVKCRELHGDTSLLQLVHPEEEALVELYIVLVLLERKEHEYACLASSYL